MAFSPLCFGATGAQTIGLRSHNPFTSIYGLPAFPELASPRQGQWRGRVSTFIVNHADQSSIAREQVTLDGETHGLELSLGRGLGRHWELGIDAPLLRHNDGYLDGAIEGWHDWFGISNTSRSGPRNQLQFRYERNGITELALEDGGSGLGDVRTWLSYDLPNHNARLRATLKLPTGSASKLRGSGATDFALDLLLQPAVLQRWSSLHLSVHAGLLALGDGDVLADLQRNWVPYGGVNASWQATERLSLLLLLSAQGRYFKSDLDEIGASTVQLTAGFSYRWPRRRLAFIAGLVEDVVSDTTPDFALQFELKRMLQ